MRDAPDRGETVHASCVVLGEAGILIRGPSGAGKSTLARRLVAAGGRSGRFARLVADDRVAIRPAGGRLVARPVPPLEGLLEIRGLGLVEIAFEPACILRLVLDLVSPEEVRRLPEPSESLTTLCGTSIARLAATREDALDLALCRIRGSHDTIMTE